MDATLKVVPVDVSDDHHNWMFDPATYLTFDSVKIMYTLLLFMNMLACWFACCNLI